MLVNGLPAPGTKEWAEAMKTDRKALIEAQTVTKVKWVEETDEAEEEQDGGED